MRLTLRFCVLYFAVVAGGALAAPISLTLSSSLLVTDHAGTVSFVGTVTEIGGSTTFLNGDTVSVAAPLSVNDTKFFLNFPAALAPFQSVTAPIFDVMVPGSAGVGVYTGTFTILGGANPSAQDILASQTFAVNVVPEPATGWLLIIGLGISALPKAAPRCAHGRRRPEISRPLGLAGMGRRRRSRAPCV